MTLEDAPGILDRTAIQRCSLEGPHVAGFAVRKYRMIAMFGRTPMAGYELIDARKTL